MTYTILLKMHVSHTSRTIKHKIAIIIRIAHFLRTPAHSNIVRAIFNIIIAHHHNNNKNTEMILVYRGGGGGGSGGCPWPRDTAIDCSNAPSVALCVTVCWQFILLCTSTQSTHTPILCTRIAR